MTITSYQLLLIQNMGYKILEVMMNFLVMDPKQMLNMLFLNLPLKMKIITDGIKERIIALHDAGYSNYAIVKQLDIHKHTVALWIRRNNENQNLKKKCLVKEESVVPMSIQIESYVEQFELIVLPLLQRLLLKRTISWIFLKKP